MIEVDHRPGRLPQIGSRFLCGSIDRVFFEESHCFLYRELEWLKVFISDADDEL
jgi:hypothetical protein